MLRSIIKPLSNQNNVKCFTNVSRALLKRTSLLNQQIQHSIPAKSLQSSFIHSTGKSLKTKSLSHSDSHYTSKTHSDSQISPPDASSTASQHNANARLLISFTCKVCSHRSTKTMSRHAYDHGVVIIQCSSCQNRHLIADHLGWFRDGRTTIEDLMYEQGEKVLKFVDNTRPDILEWCPDIIAEEKKKLKELKKSKSRKELSLGLDKVEDLEKRNG